MKNLWRLYLVADPQYCTSQSVEETVELAAKGGVSIVQLRCKNLSTRDFVQLAAKIKPILRRHDIPLVINDRLDVTLAVDADGVHVGQTDIDCETARRILGLQKIIGLSVENFQQLREAPTKSLNYIALSPVFYTPTKHFDLNPWTLDGIRQARTENSEIPMVAIGGINAKNAREVILAGADGIAVVSAICSNPDPYAAAKALRRVIEEGRLQSET